MRLPGLCAHMEIEEEEEEEKFRELSRLLKQKLKENEALDSKHKKKPSSSEVEVLLQKVNAK